MATNTAPNPYQVAADATAGYAAGYSAMLEYLASQEAQNQQSFLDLIGAPQGAIDQFNQSSQFPADVLYGAYGDIPGTALSQQGAAFGQAANDLSGIFGQQLAYNANLQAQEMANARKLASYSSGGGGGGGGGGGDEGLTPYQQASLAMRAMEFQSDQERYARQDELDWAKFESQLAQDQAEAESNALIWSLAADVLDIKLPKGALSGLTSTSGLSSVLGLFSDQQDNANAAADDLRKRRQQLRGMISFDGINDGLNKNQVVGSIMANIRNLFPGFAGMKEAKVRSDVRTYVNENWANYKAGAPKPSTASSPAGFNQMWDKFNAGSTMRSAYKSYVDSLGPSSIISGQKKPSYRVAYTRVMGAIRSEWAGRWNMRVKKQVSSRVNLFLRSQGLRRPSRPNPPRRPPRPNLPRPNRPRNPNRQ